jgi:hypothetical protein
MDGCDTDVIFIATTVSYCGGEVGWGIELQTETSRVQLSMGQWNFKMTTLKALRSTWPLTETSTRDMSWG